MDNLEKYIEDNTHLFNEEPKGGHFERFEEKRSANKAKKRHTLLRSSMRIASLIALLVMSGLYVNEHYFANRDGDVLYVNPEFSETQFYYQTMINKGVNSLQTFDNVLNAEQKEMLINEMTTADTLFRELQDDLAARPDDPRVIQAMIGHYRMKAEVINKIVTDLEKINMTKTPTHYEKSKI